MPNPPAAGLMPAPNPAADEVGVPKLRAAPPKPAVDAPNPAADEAGVPKLRAVAPPNPKELVEAAPKEGAAVGVVGAPKPNEGAEPAPNPNEAAEDEGVPKLNDIVGEDVTEEESLESSEQMGWMLGLEDGHLPKEQRSIRIALTGTIYRDARCILLLLLRARYTFTHSVV
eukprot:631398-Prorocentrum_minimum.AAC.6